MYEGPGKQYDYENQLIPYNIKDKKELMKY